MNIEEKLAIAVAALQCFADKCGWMDGQYDRCGDQSSELHNLFIGLDMDNLASRAISFITGQLNPEDFK